MQLSLNVHKSVFVWDNTHTNLHIFLCLSCVERLKCCWPKLNRHTWKEILWVNSLLLSLLWSQFWPFEIKYDFMIRTILQHRKNTMGWLRMTCCLINRCRITTSTPQAFCHNQAGISPQIFWMTLWSSSLGDSQRALLWGDVCMPFLRKHPWFYQQVKRVVLTRKVRSRAPACLIIFDLTIKLTHTVVLV